MRGRKWLPQFGPATHSATGTQVPARWSPGAWPGAVLALSVNPPGVGWSPRCHGNWIRTWWSRLGLSAASATPTTRALCGPGMRGRSCGSARSGVAAGTARKRLR